MPVVITALIAAGVPLSLWLATHKLPSPTQRIQYENLLQKSRAQGTGQFIEKGIVIAGLLTLGLIGYKEVKKK